MEVWLEWFNGAGIRPGEDDELRRLGFLAYWLGFFVTPRLRSRGGELPELAFALAARLSLGERISLGPALVANLYADMDRVVTNSAVPDGVGARVDIWAPLWLLQIWMWERYKRLCPPQLKAPQFPVSNVRVLHWSRRKRTTMPEEALQILQDQACFEWRPYRYNSLNWMEPKWFNVDTVLVSCRGKDKPEWLLDYIAVISQTVLTGFQGDDMDNTVLYNPHLAARQFGYDQAAPVPIVGEFDIEGIEIWIPGTARYGMPSEDYTAWCNSGQFYRHQIDDRHGCLVVQGHENGASPLQLNANKRCAVVPALDQFTHASSGEHNSCIGQEQQGQIDNGSHENETKVIVLGLRARDKDSTTTSAKWKKEKKQRGGKCAEDEGNNKKKRKARSSTSPLRLEGQEYTALQDPDCKKSDELAQFDSDDECIVLGQHENKCEVINLDDDEDDEQSALDPKDHNMQLVLELEEFVRSGLLTQWEESADEDDLSGRRQENLKKSFNDPYAEAAMKEYPMFFRLIPQKPHYRGFVNNDEALGDLAYSGLWFLLVDLAKEVLKTSCDTHASEILCLMKKAERLQQLGFNVKHLIARLKEPHNRLRKLQDCRARLELARETEKDATRVESLSSHLSKLKHNIRKMESHLGEKKQAFISSGKDKLNEGLDLVSLEKEVETAEKYCQAMKDEVAAMRMKYSVSGA